jgi:hypothetical protein
MGHVTFGGHLCINRPHPHWPTQVSSHLNCADHIAAYPWRDRMELHFKVFKKIMKILRIRECVRELTLSFTLGPHELIAEIFLNSTVAITCRYVKGVKNVQNSF